MEEEKITEEAGSTLVESLRDIQSEYMLLEDLYEKEKDYSMRLSEMMKQLQFEVDSTIPIRPQAIGQPCKEAYLVSEAVVVLVDDKGNKISRPLYKLPPNVIVSVIQECAPELRRLIAEKRRETITRVKALERVLREMKKAETTFKQTKKEEIGIETNSESQNEETEAISAGEDEERKSFAFKANFQSKKEHAILK
jgi:hypothetical protein